MSVENKIKELLTRKGDNQLTEANDSDTSLKMQGSSQKATFETMPGVSGVGKAVSAKMSKDSSKASMTPTPGDLMLNKQGSSQDAEFDEVDSDYDEDEHNLGSKASAPVASNVGLPKMKGDAKAVKVPAMEEVTQDDVKLQLNSIFGEELSEEFKSKATSIFEAAVIARVNNEMENVTTRLEEQAQEQLDEQLISLVEKVDSYLNYVIEQWMEENTLAVENGLRTEIAEDFITGLKSLFKEHYIEVPEEKYDVLEQLQNRADELEAKLNEAVDTIVDSSNELSNLKQSKIFEEQTKDLAATEVEKLKKLVEGVEFEYEDLYREKVSVIKENYFPKTAYKSPEKFLVEESGTTPTTFDNSTMSKYVQSLSRTVKTR